MILALASIKPEPCFLRRCILFISYQTIREDMSGLSVFREHFPYSVRFPDLDESSEGLPPFTEGIPCTK